MASNKKPCTTKRKAEEEAPEGEASPLKRVECSELELGATMAAASAARCEEAPAKKMTRLPQEEVVSILAKKMDDDALPPEYRALKLHSPDLIPWPEEETDEELVTFYDVVRMFYEIGADFREFQAWVRTQYDKNGYVEVDDEYLANKAQVKAMTEEARKEALKAFDFSVYDL